MKKEIHVTCSFNEDGTGADILQVIQNSFEAFLKKELSDVANFPKNRL